MAEKKFGFRDLRTAAELALAPSFPASVKVGRINLTALLPIPKTGKIGKIVGKIQKAADLTGSAYSTYKQTVETLKELKAMASEIKQTIKDLDAQAKELLKGNISITDVQQQANIMLNRGIATNNFFQASDLVQMSGFKSGPLSPDELRAAKARLDQRRKDLQALYVNLTKQIGSLVKKGPNGSHVVEDYTNRSSIPPVGPTIPLEAQGRETETQSFKDKLKNRVKGVKIANAKPSFWQRAAFFAKTGLTAASVVKHYAKNPGYNKTLNVVFADAISGGGGDWSEPEPPPITSSGDVMIQQDASGNKIVQVAQPGKERLEVYHRSGSFTEFHPDGKVVHKSTNHAYTISLRDHLVNIDGDCHIHVGGKTTIHSRGELHLEAESDISILAPNSKFQVLAKEISIKSSAGGTTEIDGTTVKLPFLSLPPKGFVAGFGPGVAVAVDPTSVAALSVDGGAAFKASLAAFTEKSAAAKAAAAGVTTITGAITALPKIAKMMAGPAFDGALAALAVKKLTAAEEELLPAQSPLLNPLVYHQKTPSAIRYRELMFDTPEEVGDTEKYQSHVELRKILGDIPKTYTNRLPGKRTALTTTIIESETLPIIDYLDRDAFTSSFTPKTKLSPSFTVQQLADSLAFPDVANFITNDEVEDETPRPEPPKEPFPSDDPRLPSPA